jgi:hypothetical protein
MAALTLPPRPSGVAFEIDRDDGQPRPAGSCRGRLLPSVEPVSSPQLGGREGRSDGADVPSVDAGAAEEEAANLGLDLAVGELGLVIGAVL